jgi:TctA family transporter
MKEIKYFVFGILAFYLAFLGAYLFSQNTHEVFLCEHYKNIDFWFCNQIHIVTSIVLGFILGLGLIALFFKNQLK